MAKCRVLKPKRGYRFKQHGKKVMLMKRGRGGGGFGVATISCGCSGDGSCGITIDKTGSASCEGTCSGSCKWIVIELTGIAGLFAA